MTMRIAVIYRDKPLQVMSIIGSKPSKIDIQTLKMSVEQLEKGGYETFMLKEIFEQPDTLR